MDEKLHFVRVEFDRFKAFKHFSLYLRHFNILVGPNNAGKSTVIVAFRVLSAALRKARSRNPEAVRGPDGNTFGYKIDLSGISVAEENIFFNYDDVEAASVTFVLSNKNKLTLYFPEQGNCLLIADSEKGTPRTTSTFKRQFNCPIGFVPILGPVDHREPLYREEAARLALLNYTASRNFRNIWYHYPDRFDEFRELLQSTWPGMDIQRPVIDSYEKPVLHMFCPEERIPREIFWAGFGFQVWCQMLTHLVLSSECSLFLIDEPDIYLHSDLQRQLLGLLRNLGPDILIATHSTEIITEAEADDIVLVNKKRQRSKRIKHPSELAEVFAALGSNLNPILTQLAKTKRAVFVEGKDFQILAKFARKLDVTRVANRSDFAVIPVDGFNPERVRNLIKGMETTLGNKIQSAVILDRDYRSQEECDSIVDECKKFCEMVVVHGRKEIENFLLVPPAVDRAARNRLADRNTRTGDNQTYVDCAYSMLEEISSKMKTFVTSRCLASRRRYEKLHNPGIDETTSNESALEELEAAWINEAEKIRTIPGKEALSAINTELQNRYGISLTATAIIDAMKDEEVPDELRELIDNLSLFAK